MSAIKNLNQEEAKGVDNFVKGQQQAEQAGSPGAIGTGNGALNESVIPTTPSLEAAKKTAREGK
ncbi:MAG: hypothetical protein NTY36_01930 [Deltaproteobacteria bacterium]|nr:hypothetical protein [Deltaproteobacteria bacterium]